MKNVLSTTLLKFIWLNSGSFLLNSKNDGINSICVKRYFSSKRSPRQVECYSDNPAEIFSQETDFFLVNVRKRLKKLPVLKNYFSSKHSSGHLEFSFDDPVVYFWQNACFFYHFFLKTNNRKNCPQKYIFARTPHGKIKFSLNNCAGILSTKFGKNLAGSPKTMESKI